MPTDALVALKRIDPRLDAYIVRTGEVWVVQYQEDRERILEGRRMIEEERAADLDGYVELNVSAHLMAQGFAQLDILSFAHGTSPGFLEKDVGMILARTEKDVADRKMLAILESDGTLPAQRRAKVLQERINSSVKSDHAWAYRGRRSFTSRLQSSR